MSTKNQIHAFINIRAELQKSLKTNFINMYGKDSATVKSFNLVNFSLRTSQLLKEPLKYRFNKI